MQRAAIYARYSSDRQSERSIDDQVRDCRALAERLGVSIADVYTDAAISGSISARPSWSTLLDVARQGGVDIILAESLDRIGRDQEHIAGAFKRLAFAGVKIHTIAEGEISEIHIGLNGTMGALYIKDLALRTRRGQRGRVEAGYAAGGLGYGYDEVRSLDSAGQLVLGQRQINPAEADVIRRIFAEYVAGRSPREIAQGLNHDGIPAPRGGLWNASTINGNRARGNGILHNQLYRGVLIWNRQRFVRNPDTGKRQAILNPRHEWVEKEHPELRIIDDAVWTSAQAVKGEFAGRALPHRRRPKHALSGLIHCSCCGGQYIVIGSNRMGCANYRERGTCDNKISVRMTDVEARVFAAIKTQMTDPELIAVFMAEYRAQYAAMLREKSSARARVEADLQRIQGEIDLFFDWIVKGLVEQSEDARDRLAAMTDRKQKLKAQLAAMQADTPPLSAITPSVEVYRRWLDRVTDALNDAEHRRDAVEIMHQLIDRLTIHPSDKKGEYYIDVSGQLAIMLEAANLSETGDLKSMVTVVAGAGFEPAAFRL
ncbi:recombinase family protein [Novispirillum itersonii]|uniref:recombinase family protein n=1 Tax=Novispirillum itersonii TaxID=189 RepID=UPI0038992FCB